MDASFAYDDARGVYDWVDDAGDAIVRTRCETCSAETHRDFAVARGLFFALVFSVPLWAAMIGLVVAIAN